MRTLLILLLGFTGLSALISGISMIAAPNDSMQQLPVLLLGPTPFEDLLIPGILLAVVIGGLNMLALFFYIQHYAGRYNLSLAAGLVTSAWIIGQMTIIGAANGLQLLYLAAGVLTILVSLQLKRQAAT